MPSVVFDDLTASEKAGVVWGFFWRGILATIAAGLGGGIAGFILGFLLGLAGHFLGWSLESVRTGGAILGGIAGVLVGLTLYWQYIRWLFRTKWSGYQLRFIKLANADRVDPA
jgi:ABC-type amino acid transport system permease subunit